MAFNVFNRAIKFIFPQHELNNYITLFVPTCDMCVAIYIHCCLFYVSDIANENVNSSLMIVDVCIL